MAGGGIARNDRRSVLPAFQRAFARAQVQVRHQRRLAVTLHTLLRQNRCDIVLKRDLFICLRHQRQTHNEEGSAQN